jgi:nondiscriminating aspartyl-tRNA synthetase
MQRTYISELIPGKEVLIKGWTHDIRTLAKLKFLILRDSSGKAQCIIGKNLLTKTNDLTLESVVEIKGKTKKADVKAEGVKKDLEIEVTEIKIINKAEALPIQINDKASKAELSTRLDNRSLDIRKQNISAIFKIQSTIINSFRNFFYNKNFIEIQPPGIIATSTEGGTDLFEIKYFEKKAYLAQSPQLYKQLMAISLEKVFSTNTIWRAEKHDTSKHINEIRQMDIECAFENDIEVMKYLEEVVKFIVKEVLEKNKKELEILKLDLKVPNTKYLTYTDAINTLNKNGFKLKIGDDFEPEAERKLCEIFPDTIIFTYEWPINMKPFYIWPKSPEKNISAGFDAVYGNVEISSGGQRVHLPEVLIQQLKDKKLKPKDFEWYIDAFRYGAPIHSGWSIGLERLTQAILKLKNIREATLFPRDRKRLTP